MNKKDKIIFIIVLILLVFGLLMSNISIVKRLTLTIDDLEIHNEIFANIEKENKKILLFVKMVINIILYLLM